MTRCGVLLASLALLLESSGVNGQTTSGTSATIVVPVIAQTASFGSEVTVYNPNASAIIVSPVFYDAQNTATPGPKACTSVSLGANVTKAFTLATQCALPAGSNFGLLILSESTGTQRFYGYARTQTPPGVGFSTEGFPIENFNDQIQHATGLKRVAASGGLPANQTNCFVATLGDAVNYELRLFDGGTNVQLGSTLSGTLAAFQQYRYLDVFALAGVAAGDKTNVRAQFTNLTGSKKKLIGFCTVQENTTFSADFRIAKSYGGTPQNAFVQGGNAFGTTATLGTTDNQPLNVVVNNQRVMRYEPTTSVPNVLGGYLGNSATAGVIGATIAGGGNANVNCGTGASPCTNVVTDNFGTIGGGFGNRAGNSTGNTLDGVYATVGGGDSNTATGAWSVVSGGVLNRAAGFYTAVGGGEDNYATGDWATVAGGSTNTAGGQGAVISGGDHNFANGKWATVAGGDLNSADGEYSFAAGRHAVADQSGCAVFALWSSFSDFRCAGTNNLFRIGADHGLSVDYSSQNGSGYGTRWVLIGDLSGVTINTWTGAALTDAGVWLNGSSSKTSKTDFAPVDSAQVLQQLAALPITSWRYKAGEGNVRHIGPMAEDFWDAFKVGYGDHTIADLDARGVALAAIQALNSKLESQQATMKALAARLEALERGR